jgi:hypothetical protein
MGFALNAVRMWSEFSEIPQFVLDFRNASLVTGAA